MGSILTYRLGIACVAMGSVALGGCSKLIHYAPEASAFDVCRPPAGEDAPETIVGIALSGGGSRAAVFAASGLEALWEHGVIDELSHLSSVSGGSIAASYFVSRQPECDQASEEEREGCWRGFFADYQQAMRYNFVGAMAQRQFWRGRGLSSSRFARSFMHVLDREFLKGRTFADLKRGPDGTERPILMLNASSYDEGRRFVFSNLCLPAQVDEPDRLHNGAQNLYDPLSNEGLRAVTFSQPGCDRAVPGELPLSLAVASSAAFPGVIGPITLEVPAGCGSGGIEYLHLGDGGLFENTGIDALEEIVLRERASSDGRLRRVLLISLDSGLLETREALTQVPHFSLVRNPGRLLMISQRRGHAYHDAFWDRMKGLMREEGIDFEFISMHFTDADLDVWPQSCEEMGEPGTQETRRRIRERLRSIDPALSIGPCDADLLQMAGHAVIHAALEPGAVGRLQCQGFAVHNAAD